MLIRARQLETRRACGRQAGFDWLVNRAVGANEHCSDHRRNIVSAVHGRGSESINVSIDGLLGSLRRRHAPKRILQFAGLHDLSPTAFRLNKVEHYTGMCVRGQVPDDLPARFPDYDFFSGPLANLLLSRPSRFDWIELLTPMDEVPSDANLSALRSQLFPNGALLTHISLGPMRGASLGLSLRLERLGFEHSNSHRFSDGTVLVTATRA